jgi:hypothetical protein
MRRAPALLATALLLAVVTADVSAQAAKPAPAPKPAAASPSPQANPKVNAQASALATFQANLQSYLQLRENLAKKLKPLSPTASSAELAARQDALAAAIKSARKGARQGDLIPPMAATQIQQTIADDFRQRRPAATKAVFHEVPPTLRAAVNRAFPDDAALATMPALLLKNLPVLPDNLQYRLLQRDLVILDGDTRLIIDYIANVLPAH